MSGRSPFLSLIVLACIQVNLPPTLAIDDNPCGAGRFTCRTEPMECLETARVCDESPDCENAKDEEFETCYDPKGYNSYILKDGNVFDRFKPAIVEEEECDLTLTFPSNCTCQFHTRLVCTGMGLQEVPVTSPALTRLFLMDNDIDEITEKSLTIYPNLEFIQMRNCSIKFISSDAFQGLNKLQRIYLDRNYLSHLPAGLFMDQSSLLWLFMQENGLYDWSDQIFDITEINNGNIVWLNLTSNNLRLEEEKMFAGASPLHILEVGFNSIVSPHPNIFKGLRHLGVLRLQNNYIKFLPKTIFHDLTSLVELDLSYNKLRSVSRRHFEELTNLTTLSLKHNPLEDLTRDFAFDLAQLSSIDLTEVRIPNIDIEMFSKNEKLEFAYLASFRYCRYVPQVRVCRPITDGISTVNDLFVNPWLRVLVWVMAFSTCLGNLFVLLARSTKEQRHRPLSMCIKYLCAADLVMGIYLFIIAYHDVRYRGSYNRFALDWMTGPICQVAGVLGFLSTETSILTLTFLSLDRYNKVVHPLHPIHMRYIPVLTVIWLLGIAMALVPVAMVTGSGFYGSNGVCVPLHIHDPWADGWQYSAVIYLGVNGTCLMVLTACYVAMFISVRESQRYHHVTFMPRPPPPQQQYQPNSGVNHDHAPHGNQEVSPMLTNNASTFHQPPNQPATTPNQPATTPTEPAEPIRQPSWWSQRENCYALRMWAIVVTDAMCWIPIIVVKILALSGVHISERLYGWLVVFALPINSSINPILYTLTTSWFIRKMAGVLSVTRRSSNTTSHTPGAALPLQALEPKPAVIL